MSNEAKIFKYNTLSDVAVRFRSDLNDFDYVLHYTSMLLLKIFSIGTTTLKMIRRGFSKSMQTRTSLAGLKN